MRASYLILSLLVVLICGRTAAFSAKPIADDPVLFVVHPYQNWDMYDAARRGIDLAVERAKRSSVSVAYVLDSKEPVYLKDKYPTLPLMAPTGRFPDPVAARTVYLAGGNWRYCLSNALGSVLANFPRDGVRVHILSEATFIFLGKENLADHLANLQESERVVELGSEFQGIVDRWLKDEYCLVVHYEGVEMFRTKGTCAREASIFVGRHGTL